MPAADRLDTSPVCECEAVTAGEVRYAVNSLTVNNRWICAAAPASAWAPAGELCACRAAGLLTRFKVSTPQQSIAQLSQFLNERWKGVRPIARGDALRESEFTSWVYRGLCGLEARADKEQEADDAI